ncbi:MAG: sporulation protein [Lachnospiraceae bacterium]|nr:sporulation protein [Lachnospiraceae bacterium]
MANGNINETIASLFNGMETYLSTKTVVGEPLKIDDTIIIPLVDVSFGLASGSFSKEHSGSGAGGIGGKMRPSSVLVIHNGTTRLINIATNTGMDKLLDLVPDFVDTFKSKQNKKGRSAEDNAARDLAADAVTDAVTDAVDILTEEDEISS